MIEEEDTKFSRFPLFCAVSIGRTVTNKQKELTFTASVSNVHERSETLFGGTIF